MRNLVLLFVLPLFLVNQPEEAEARPTATTSIIVSVGSCICGNHMASFEADYHGKKIEVGMYYGGKTFLIKENMVYKEWFHVFCPNAGDDDGPLSGKKVRLEGNWEGVYNGVRHFSAYKVYVFE